MRRLGLAARFALLLTAALVGANVIAALVLAREGSGYDRAVRIQGDMGRLIALVTALEAVDAESGAAIVAHSSTGFTRFSLGVERLAPGVGPRAPDLEAAVMAALPARQVAISEGQGVDQTTPVLLLLSVRLEAGPLAGQWLNALVYPLPVSAAWRWKAWYFVPLGVSLAGTLLVGLWFVRRMTDPLRRLAEGARAAGRGDHSVRLDERGAGELRAAAVAFNEMQDRIATFETERARIVAAIGHDLRTPITGLRIRAEMFDDAQERADMVRILDGMTVMAEDLIQYARGGDTGELRREADLVALVRGVCEERGIAFQGMAPLVLRLRPVAITRAVRNLIDNALRYGGGARVRLALEADEAVVRVEDDGPGIAEAQLAGIVAPFARGDQSRSDATGGIGLGLSIAQCVAQSHGGRLRLANRAGGGLLAELRLPV